MYLLLRRVRCSVTEVFKFCWTMFVQVKGMCVGACGLQVAGRVLVTAGWGLCVGNCSLGIAGWGLTIPVNGRQRIHKCREPRWRSGCGEGVIGRSKQDSENRGEKY